MFEMAPVEMGHCNKPLKGEWGGRGGELGRRSWAAARQHNVTQVCTSSDARGRGSQQEHKHTSAATIKPPTLQINIISHLLLCVLYSISRHPGQFLVGPDEGDSYSMQVLLYFYSDEIWIHVLEIAGWHLKQEVLFVLTVC